MNLANVTGRKIGIGSLAGRVDSHPATLAHLGVDEVAWAAFAQQPLCIMINEALLALMERGLWRSVTLRASWFSNRAGPRTREPTRLFSTAVGMPTPEFERRLRQAGSLRSYVDLPSLEFRPQDAALLASRLRGLAAAHHDENEKVLELEQLVARLGVFSGSLAAAARMRAAA